MVSLIITVKNEYSNLPAWLVSIQRQSKLPHEIIIVDGGSNDGTWEWLQTIASATIKVFQKVGNIASGRNFAITQATGELIVATDAGCVYQESWFKDLVNPLETGQAQFAATAFKPWLEKNDGLLIYLLAASTTPSHREFEKDWLPSSRSVAFTKKVWEMVGGYPEWIPYCEDVIFDLNIEKKGFNPFFVRETLVAWRPRPTLKAYFRQLYNYTRSDGHGKLFWQRQVIRYGVYGGLVILVFLASQYSWWLLGLAVLGGLGYMGKFWLRFGEFSKAKSLPFRLFGFVLLPFIVAFGDVAKMSGWPVGVWERWQGKVII